jgi:hypothetical protein
MGLHLHLHLQCFWQQKIRCAAFVLLATESYVLCQEAPLRDHDSYQEIHMSSVTRCIFSF